MINGIIKLFYSEVVKTNMKKMPNGEYSLKDEYKEIKNLTLKIDSLALNIIKLIIVMITLILAFEINTLLGIGLFLIEFLYQINLVPSLEFLNILSMHTCSYYCKIS